MASATCTVTLTQGIDHTATLDLPAESVAGILDAPAAEVVQYLLDFMKEARIDRAGCFAYSPIEGAGANELPGALPDEVRQERQARFMAVAEEGLRPGSRRRRRAHRFRSLVAHTLRGFGTTAPCRRQSPGRHRQWPPLWRPGHGRPDRAWRSSPGGGGPAVRRVLRHPALLWPDRPDLGLLTVGGRAPPRPPGRQARKSPAIKAGLCCNQLRITMLPI